MLILHELAIVVLAVRGFARVIALVGVQSRHGAGVKIRLQMHPFCNHMVLGIAAGNNVGEVSPIGLQQKAVGRDLGLDLSGCFALDQPVIRLALSESSIDGNRVLVI